MDEQCFTSPLTQYRLYGRRNGCLPFQIIPQYGTDSASGSSSLFRLAAHVPRSPLNVP